MNKHVDLMNELVIRNDVLVPNLNLYQIINDTIFHLSKSSHFYESNCLVLALSKPLTTCPTLHYYNYWVSEALQAYDASANIPYTTKYSRGKLS